jgi:hypothetical protein
VALIAFASGCSSPPPAAPAITEPLPVLNSPASVLRALQWGYERRDFDFMSTLFTADFVFVFSQLDSAGNAFRDRPWTREDELIYMLNLFIGGGSEPPADRITLDLPATLNTFPSSRPGHHPNWHKEIRAEVNLRVIRGESAYEIRGPGLFFFVRGDSAAIPEDLVDRGFVPDSTRWWIERWEDETVATGARPAARGPAPASPNPASSHSWGRLKVHFR